MTPFAQTVLSWHDFYILIGTASATLVGLLFVALTLNYEKMQQAANAPLRRLAYRTFIIFIYLLLISGILLVPSPSALGNGIPLLLVSLLGISNTYQDVVAMRRDAPRTLTTRRIMGRFGNLFISLCALAVLSIILMTGNTDALYWLTGVVLLLVVSASSNAWNMLMEITEIS
jgi:hypothetical protein